MSNKNLINDLKMGKGHKCYPILSKARTFEYYNFKPKNRFKRFWKRFIDKIFHRKKKTLDEQIYDSILNDIKLTNEYYNKLDKETKITVEDIEKFFKKLNDQNNMR